MDFYTVELRLTGATLDPTLITQELELRPSLSHGKIHSPREKLPIWCFAGEVPSREWQSLEDGLEHVLNALSGKEKIIQSYLSTYEAFWWCGHFQSSFDGGPTLTAQLLGRLGALGAPLMLRNYFSDDEA
jgi:hypothetical protein